MSSARYEIVTPHRDLLSEVYVDGHFLGVRINADDLRGGTLIISERGDVVIIEVTRGSRRIRERG